jgi:(S)-3,5-dihydroxyphenylglycine transaminase
MTILSKSDLHHSLSDPSLDTITFLNEIMARHPDAISFAPGAPNPTFFDDLDVSKAIERYIDYLMQKNGFTLAQSRRQIYQYGPSQGQINELVARSLMLDHGMQVLPKDIVITVGCQEAVLLAVRALCATRNDVLAIINPRFVGIAGAAQVLDVETVAVDESDSAVDLECLRTSCNAARRDGKRVRALYVAPDFSNPSGMVLDLSARQDLLKVAEDEDLLVLEDNAYGFTAEPATALPTLKALDKTSRVIYLGTFSKICLPGVRVGFVVADQAVTDPAGDVRSLAQELASLKNMITLNTSPVAQAIVGGLLLEHGCSLASVGREKSSLYQRNLKLLLDALERHVGRGFNDDQSPITWNTPHGGFYVTINLPIRADNDLLEVSVGQYGVLWTPMSNFYVGHVGDNQIRLSCSYLMPDKIEEGVRRLAAFLRDERVCGHKETELAGGALAL